MYKVIKERILPFLKKNMIIALIVIMVILSFAVVQKNEQTVDKLVMDTTSSFISVSIIKGTADMIEGSTLFGIEVGDVVQPVLDSVNVVWKFLLCALAFWGCLKLFITLPTTVGTSSSVTRTEAPKHSASTDKSIRLTDARDGTLSAIAFIPFA